MAERSGEDAGLAEQIEHLAEHVKVLREVIDEFRDEFVWAVRNDRLAEDHPTVPLIEQLLNETTDAADAAERVARLKPPWPPPQPELRPAAPTVVDEHGNGRRSQKSLFGDDEEVELAAPAKQRKIDPTTLEEGIVDYLSQQDVPLGIRTICAAMGFPDVDPHDPLTNPVHRALAALRDTGRIEAIEPERGDPSFRLPPKPIPAIPDSIVRAVEEVDHAFDQLNEFVRVYGNDRGPVEWLHVRADAWLDRQLDARSRLHRAQTIAHKSRWDWQQVLELARKRLEPATPSGEGSSGDSRSDIH